MMALPRAARAVSRITLVYLAGSQIAAAAAAQSAQAPIPARPQLQATKIDRAPRIDGRLDEAEWQQASFLREFTQREPREGQPATQHTEVAFLYTDEALYIGARLRSDSAMVRALVSRRDREETSDQLLVSLDTYHDARTAYTFGVTAAGVRIDYYHPNDFEGNRVYSYDPVWEAETVVDSTGWSAEIRIPFTQLRFNVLDPQVWGVNVARLTPARNEVSYWQLVRRNETGWASRMGDLVGISGIRPSRRVELLPYVASEARLFSQVNAANPFSEKREAGWRAGGDVKMGIGPSLTLEATFNPDFGQVEADPAEVNLSAFETIFPERRPFFLEGTQILGGRGEFYSRRIGAPPVIRPPTSFAETRNNTTILGAAKMSGRLASGLSIGLLTALTDDESVETFDVRTQRNGNFQVAPLSGYGVMALQQEFGTAGRTSSVANVMLTGVERDLEAGSLLEAVLAQRAYSGLADYRIRWKGGQYDMSVFAGFSYVAGDTLAILGQQLSSRRYYQRPDNEHVSLRRDRTSLRGYKFGINHSKLSGKHWLWDIDYFEESPGYELNDVGRIGSTDDRGVVWDLMYRETTPGKYLRNYNVGVQPVIEWNYGGDRTFTQVVAFSGATLRNYWQANLDFGYFPRWQSDNLTRGGPLMQTLNSWQTNFSLSNRAGSRTRWRMAMSISGDEADGWSITPSAGLSFRPGSQWEVSIDPRFATGTGSRQYIATLPGGTQRTYGARYLFSYIERAEAAARIRVNYAITPDLTLETYAEPFASSGRFYDFGELQAARSRVLRTYGTDGTTISAPDSVGRRTVSDGSSRFTISNFDFNVRSFRSNLVLRWEWRPGSTLYAVWQQNRSSRDPFGEPVQVTDVFQGLRKDGDNFFALKVNYWLPIH
jgi:hypothetical protein